MTKQFSYLDAIIWISTSIVILISIYLTENANCLWAYLFPILSKKTYN